MREAADAYAVNPRGYARIELAWYVAFIVPRKATRAKTVEPSRQQSDCDCVARIFTFDLDRTMASQRRTREPGRLLLICSSRLASQLQKCRGSFDNHSPAERPQRL